jgi:uncharacterized cofD-like protein
MFENGKVIKGEEAIDLGKDRKAELRITTLWHEPESVCDPDAFSAIINSDIVTIGPGDLFTSVVTNITVKGIKEAIRATKAKKIYICNLMTKPGETAGYSAEDHVREIIEYLGGDYLDYVVISDTKLSAYSIKTYAKKAQAPVKLKNPQAMKALTKARIIMADVSDKKELVRHDGEKIRRTIGSLAKYARR